MRNFTNEVTNRVAYAFYVLETILLKLDAKTTKITESMIFVYLALNYKGEKAYSDKRTADLLKEYYSQINFSIASVKEETLMGLARMYGATHWNLLLFMKASKAGENTQHYESAESYLNKKILFNSVKRINAFYGTWLGSSIEAEGTYKNKITLWKGIDVFHISGEMEVTYDYVPEPYHKTVKLKITGTIIDKYDMVALDFTNADDSAVQFGTMYLTLSGDGNNLNGHFIARGLTNRTTCVGKVELEKETKVLA